MLCSSYQAASCVTAVPAGDDDVVVFAEAPRRVAGMVQALLPYAVLAPHEALQQLVRTGAASPGQVSVSCPFMPGSLLHLPLPS